MNNNKLFNLDKMVAERVHAPRVDGMPIYARTDDNEYPADGSKKMKTEKWANVVKKKYTSPDNIRRVFITYRAVYVHLYQPIKGVSNRSLKLEWEFNSDVSEALRTLNHNCRLTGSGISAIMHPWVCSNLEELYFDHTVLFCEDIMNSGYGNIYELFKKAGDIPKNILKNLFIRFCLPGVTDIRARFPRLKAVGFIEPLEELYTDNKLTNNDNPDSLNNLWYQCPAVKQASDAGKAVLWKPGGLPELNTARSVKANLYTYDKEVLNEYFENMELKIRNFCKNDVKKRPPVNGIETRKGFEILLDNILEYGGMEAVENAVTIALKPASYRERKELYEELTATGRNLYGSVFGINKEDM